MSEKRAKLPAIFIMAGETISGEPPSVRPLGEMIYQNTYIEVKGAGVKRWSSLKIDDDPEDIEGASEGPMVAVDVESTSSP